MIILIHNEKHFIFLNPNFFTIYRRQKWFESIDSFFVWEDEDDEKNRIFFVSTMDSILYIIHFIQFNIVWYEWFLSFIFFFIRFNFYFLVNLTRPSHRRNRIIYLFSISSIQFFTFTQQWKKNSLSVSLFFCCCQILIVFIPLFFFFLSSC